MYVCFKKNSKDHCEHNQSMYGSLKARVLPSKFKEMLEGRRNPLVSRLQYFQVATKLFDFFVVSLSL